MPFAVVGAVAGAAIGGGALTAAGFTLGAGALGGAAAGMSLGGSLGNVLGGGAGGGGVGGGGVGGGGSPTQQGQQAQQMVDPFAQYRPEYASQLNQLMTTPASVQTLPGFQSQMDLGTQQIQRQAASTGQLQSGQELLALQQFGANYQGQAFQQQLTNLQNLSGATGMGAAGGQAGITAAQGAATTQSQNIGSLPGALQQMGKILNLGGTGGSSASSQPTAMNTAVDPTSGAINPSFFGPAQQPNYLMTPQGY